MKSHGITMIGKIWIQNVPTLPTWTPDDVARVIFVEEENIVYVGGTISYGNWIAVGHYFKDVGLGFDPETGNPYFNRFYYMKIENGQIILEYEED